MTTCCERFMGYQTMKKCIYPPGCVEESLTKLLFPSFSPTLPFFLTPQGAKSACNDFIGGDFMLVNRNARSASTESFTERRPCRGESGRSSVLLLLIPSTMKCTTMHHHRHCLKDTYKRAAVIWYSIPQSIYD